MKTIVYSLIGSILLSSGASTAFADALDRKRERLEEQLVEQKKTTKQARADLAKCKSEFRGGGNQVQICEDRKAEFIRQKPVRAKWISDDIYEFGRIEKECDSVRERYATAGTACDSYQSDLDNSMAEEKNIRRKMDRLEDESEKDASQNKDCVNCNQGGLQGGLIGGQIKYQGKSGWESFADIIRAATPLGLGAMGLYGGIKAMDLQSHDYNNYAGIMAVNGLPFAPPSANGYGGTLGAAMGPAFLASMFMNGAGFSGCCFNPYMGGGIGIGGGIGYPGMGMMGYGGGYPGMGLVGGFAGGIVGGFGGGFPGMGMMGIGGGIGYPGVGMMGYGGGYPGMGLAGGFAGGVVGGFGGGYPGMGMMGYGGGYPGMGMMGYGGGYPGMGMMGYGGGYPGMGMMGMGGGYPGMGMMGYGGGYPGMGMMGMGGGYAGMGMPPVYGGGGYPMPMPYPAGGYGGYAGGAFPGNPYPYANPYYSTGMNPGCYGGMCNYNPWFSTVNNQIGAGGMTNFYANQQAQMAGQIREMQQQAMLGQDAQVAQRALYDAQTRYQQVLGNMSGTYYGGGGGGYYGGGGGYYGGGGGYYPGGGMINNPPAVNSTRM